MKIKIELTEDQAWAFAQFLKRSYRETYAQNAQNKAEEQLMYDAGEAIFLAFIKAGVNPR